MKLKTKSNEIMTLDEAAELLGKSKQTIRVLMQTGQLPIGFVVKTSTKYQYIIPKAKFSEFTGIKVD